MEKVKAKSYDSAISSPRGREGKSNKVDPTIRIDHEHLPEAKEWKVGDQHHIHMNVKMVGNSQSRFQNEGEYEIHGLDHCDEGCDGEHHEHTMPAEEDGEEDKKDIDRNEEGDEHNVEKPEK